jgi:IrrE N-terminal-like domain
VPGKPADLLPGSEHGIPVYPIDELPDQHCSQEAVAYFTAGRRSAVWSAALVPVGAGRLILENTGHSLARRCASVAHELSHHFLEHEFDDVLLSAYLDAHQRAAGGNYATVQPGPVVLKLSQWSTLTSSWREPGWPPTST